MGCRTGLGAVVLVLLLLLGGCCCEETDESSVAAEGIRQADLALAAALNAGDMEAFRQLLAEDTLFFGEKVLVGADEVTETWSVFPQTPGLILDWKPERIEAAASGEMGFSVGRWQLTQPTESGEPTHSRGTYLTTWRKNPEGQWKATVDIGSQQELPTP